MLCCYFENVLGWWGWFGGLDCFFVFVSRYKCCCDLIGFVLCFVGIWLFVSDCDCLCWLCVIGRINWNVLVGCKGYVLVIGMFMIVGVE